MSGDGTLKTWVWVAIEQSGREENIYALEEEGTGRKVIPVFQSKEDGVVGERGFRKNPGATLEITAMQLPVVAQAARENRADIIILDAAGRILERLTPAPEE
ncbi:MAG: hypothetical protein AB1896_12635 [Thermodesulfobacteriota bacterium]